MEIGAQMFTVRDFCQDLSGLSEALKKIADIGYRCVQVSGTCAYDADWLRSELQKNGLQCVITHTPPAALQNDTQRVIRDHDRFGCDYIGLGFFDFGADAEHYDAFLDTYKPVAAALRQGGKYFMYHHHDYEFRKIGDRTILQKLAEDFAPAEMGITLDTFWVQAGGGDPAQYLELLAGRVPCIHLKDFAYGRKMAVIGEGNINFDRVFQAAEQSGTRYMLVEQDDCNGEDPFDCLRRSYARLRSWGLA